MLERQCFFSIFDKIQLFVYNFSINYSQSWLHWFDFISKSNISFFSSYLLEWSLISFKLWFESGQLFFLIDFCWKMASISNVIERSSFVEGDLIRDEKTRQLTKVNRSWDDFLKLWEIWVLRLGRGSSKRT